MPTLTYMTTLQFDFGALKQLGDSLRTLGVERPLICTDKGLVALGLVDQVRQVIPNEFTPAIFDGTPENPTEEAVDLAAAEYHARGCDGVVAFGGGSSIDLAKAVSLRVTHEGDLNGFTVMQGGRDKIGPVAPLIAIPTTSGTGSEVSRGAVIVMRNGEKLILASPHLLPKISICDPELTLGLPPLLTAATGMDAITHCIEAVMSPNIDPPAEAVGLDGIRRGLGEGHLERAVADGADRDARWNMMMASSEGAMAFVKGLGAVHSMSHAAGRIKSLNLHHGTLNAVCLPNVIRFNADHVDNRLERVRDAMGLEAGADIAGAIERLNERLGLPPSLGAMGVTADMVPGMVEHAVKDVCNFTNPRPVDAAAFEDLFARTL